MQTESFEQQTLPRAISRGSSHLSVSHTHVVVLTDESDSARLHFIMAGPYSLAAVLEVAKIHPFYNSDINYPPGPEAIQAALQRAATLSPGINFDSQPLLRKEDL